MEPIRCRCRGGYTNLIYFRRSGLSKCPLSWSAVTSEPPKAFQHSIGIVSCHLWSQTWRVTAARSFVQQPIQVIHIIWGCCASSRANGPMIHMCAHLSEGNFPSTHALTPLAGGKTVLLIGWLYCIWAVQEAHTSFFGANGQTDGDDQGLGILP